MNDDQSDRGRCGRLRPGRRSGGMGGRRRRSARAGPAARARVRAVAAQRGRRVLRGNAGSRRRPGTRPGRPRQGDDRPASGERHRRADRRVRDGRQRGAGQPRARRIHWDGARLGQYRGGRARLGTGRRRPRTTGGAQPRRRRLRRLRARAGGHGVRDRTGQKPPGRAARGHRLAAAVLVPVRRRLQRPDRPDHEGGAAGGTRAGRALAHEQPGPGHH